MRSRVAIRDKNVEIRGGPKGGRVVVVDLVKGLQFSLTPSELVEVLMASTLKPEPVAAPLFNPYVDDLGLLGARSPPAVPRRLALPESATAAPLSLGKHKEDAMVDGSGGGAKNTTILSQSKISIGSSTARKELPLLATRSLAPLDLGHQNTTRPLTFTEEAEPTASRRVGGRGSGRAGRIRKRGARKKGGAVVQRREQQHGKGGKGKEEVDDADCNPSSSSSSSSSLERTLSSSSSASAGIQHSLSCSSLTVRVSSNDHTTPTAAIPTAAAAASSPGSSSSSSSDSFDGANPQRASGTTSGTSTSSFDGEGKEEAGNSSGGKGGGGRSRSRGFVFSKVHTAPLSKSQPALPSSSMAPSRGSAARRRSPGGAPAEGGRERRRFNFSFQGGALEVLRKANARKVQNQNSSKTASSSSFLQHQQGQQAEALSSFGRSSRFRERILAAEVIGDSGLSLEELRWQAMQAMQSTAVLAQEGRDEITAWSSRGRAGPRRAKQATVKGPPLGLERLAAAATGKMFRRGQLDQGSLECLPPALVGKWMEFWVTQSGSCCQVLAEAWAASREFLSLSSLDFSRCGWGVDDQVLATLCTGSELSTVTSVNLSCASRVSDDGMAALFRAIPPGSLASVDLSDTLYGPSVLDALAETHGVSLTSIRLSQRLGESSLNGLDIDPIVLDAALARLVSASPHLVSFDVTGVVYGHDLLDALLARKLPAALQDLRMARNVRISPPYWTALVRTLAHVKHLDLRRTLITDEGVLEIIRACTELETLKISRALHWAGTLHVIDHITSLQTLYLDNACVFTRRALVPTPTTV